MAQAAEQVQVYLQALPQEGPDEVAEFLRVAGIKGARTTINACPVARYLQQKTGLVDVWVGANGAHVDQGDDAISVTLPEAVRMFVADFDVDTYPDLIQGATS